MSSSPPRVLVRDGSRHRVHTGYGQLARMILLSLEGRPEIEVMRERSAHPWDQVPRRDALEQIRVGSPEEADLELWVTPPSATLSPVTGKPRLLYTQHALSELPPAWIENIRRADRLVVPGDFDRGVFAPHHPSVDVCHQVVDTSVFKPRPDWRPEGTDRFTFIFVGSYGFRKGVDVLVRAFCRAFDDDEVELKMVCAHAGGTAFNHTLDIMRALRPRARVRFITRPRSPQWIARYYCRADAFVTLSRGEGWCMPLHEALLCGKPAIAPRSTAMGEAFTDDHVRFISTTPQKVATVEGDFANTMRSKYAHGECCHFEPDEGEAVAALREVRQQVNYNPAPAIAHIRQRYSLASMGERLSQSVRATLESAPPQPGQ